MKKIACIFASLILFTVFAVVVISTPKTVLNLLNWGEYIDTELVKAFEEKYNCQVNEEDVASSEAMYQKIQAGTTAYDVAIPGDYTVRQMYKENMLLELDVTNEKYENFKEYKTMFNDSLQVLIDANFKDDNGNVYNSYFMPYFWGAYSIIYSTRNSEVENVVEANGFKALFDRSLYNSNVKIGMYDTSRWDVAAYLLSEGLNPNITDKLTLSTDGVLSNDLQDEIVSAIKSARFDEWGNDALKRDVANGTIDLAFVQLGDFFDALYLSYDSGLTDIEFNVNIPSNTAVFFDSMVIPYTCTQYELANEFINFMMDPDNAYQNAQAIGYCPTLKAVNELYLEDALDESNYYYDGVLTLKEFINKYPMYLDPLYGKTKEEIANIKLFDPKSTQYLTACESIINRAKN